MFFVPAARRLASSVTRQNAYQYRSISSTARLAQATNAAPVVVKKGGVGGFKGA